MRYKAKLVGKRIKLLRCDRGMQQVELAEKIGVSQSLLSNIESGRCSVTLDNLIKIHEALGCPMRSFFVDIDGDEFSADMFSLQELVQALVALKKK
ncbi:helix-turn-helix transcriptional regulator [Phascolarctobacterium sp.]|uniref:helix-turn-helix domain-containing protein n=1 Tax=Phascolarctobacterium sp. TaxID=2049039 RepID=UPI0025D877EA|nr:helix-turn-helix transcriptional regulator [Phascolarctobacterium sp.]